MSLIGKNIRKIRTVKKLSQADFAKLFDLARPSVGAYEEGRAEPKIETVIQIAHHFGLSIDMLLTKEVTVNELYHFDLIEKELEQKKIRGDNMQRGIPLISREIIHDYLVKRNNKDFVAQLQRIQLPEEKGKVNRAFEISTGEMQLPSGGILAGDVVKTIRMSPDDILTEKNIYFIISKDRYYIRRLHASGKILEFKPDNLQFDVIRLSPDEIDELWLVLAVYKTDLQLPSPLEERLIKLEQKVDSLEKRIG